MTGDFNTFITAVGEITMVLAQPNEVDTVIALLDEAADWISSKNINQWLPGTFEHKQQLAAIERGEVYLAKLGNQAIATVTIQQADEPIWGKQPANALYGHRLAIKRAYAGKDVGRAVITWAEQLAAANGKEYLRLDCMADNAALNDYYKRAGFEFVRYVAGKTWSANLYQKRVASP